MKLMEIYAQYATPTLSYATVRDYCDSFDNLNYLATTNCDLKDVQRPWVVKSIISKMPPGSRLLEVGAGQPLVADVLVKLGYQVTVVDPYDGSGNGPSEYEDFKSRYPDITIIRKRFSDDLQELETESFDCIYSISVIEHVPISAIPNICNGIRKFLKRGTGRHIHAIDYVLKGVGDVYALQLLHHFTDAFGVQQQVVDDLIRSAADDCETYFLSAEAHNRWKGAVKYDDFPMRRVISLQLSLPL
ncbi:class I SAM-dependent methyltransferase [Trichlorobacter lovleyi]|uniref:Methyltransferase type 11 domain-containing protein n=1 Tax=Trichlorobacter lovleyi (strain ATCC BAA-1151 / DSM 17278 / SZ) TaxID=398767 RepID=B3E8X5_TRIL1|nr:methyltransferase domain-containing protein [Trichlorobacter lovleyi]ACD95243.1 hypothetical protein Glov_1527 [Trichlorobacter lovleyi SZ]